VVAVLSALDRPAIPGVRWTTPEQWLVKVRPLGHVDDRVVPPLLEVLEAELDGAPPIGCVLGPATRRLGGQWLGAPVAGLEELAAVVFEATEELIPPGAGCRKSSPAVRSRRRGRPARSPWSPTAPLREPPATRTWRPSRSAPERPIVDSHDLAYAPVG
jgi:hypothetical protein